MIETIIYTNYDCQLGISDQPALINNWVTDYDCIITSASSRLVIQNRNFYSNNFIRIESTNSMTFWYWHADRIIMTLMYSTIQWEYL